MQLNFKSMVNYFNYGITINPKYAQKLGEYYVYVFDGTRVLSSSEKFGFAILEKLTPEELIKKFDGTCGIDGYIINGETTKFIINK